MWAPRNRLSQSLMCKRNTTKLALSFAAAVWISCVYGTSRLLDGNRLQGGQDSPAVDWLLNPTAAQQVNERRDGDAALRDFVLSLQGGDGEVAGGHGGGYARDSGVQLHAPGDAFANDLAAHGTNEEPAAATPRPVGRFPVEKRPSAAVVDLSGKVAFIAGVSDANGFGWTIAKALHKAGATILVGTWAPLALRFEKMLGSGSLDDSRRYDTAAGPGRGMFNISKVYPLDVAFDDYSDIPDDVKRNRRFAPLLDAGRGFSISEVAEQVAKDFGWVDMLVHAIANAPEVSKPLLATSRKGYLSAQSSSAYSLISLVQRFAPLMATAPASDGGPAVLSLTYIASEKVIPGYGGGMSSSKAALESDTRTLAFEAGRKFGVRVNTISAGPLKSRAASAIRKSRDDKSFIDFAIGYNKANSPLGRDLFASDVADAALFLLSPLSKAVTGVTLYVDNGMHIMGMAQDSKSLSGDL